MLLWKFSLSAEEIVVFVLVMGDIDPKVSFFTGLMEMLGDFSSWRFREPSGVPKFRVRDLIDCLS